MTIEAGSVRKLELVENVPHLVAEMLRYRSLASSFENLDLDNDALVRNVFSGEPLVDTDQLGWLRIMTLAYYGHFAQQGKSPDKWIFIDDLKAQLVGDDERHGDTWKHRDIEGQLGRVYVRYNEYLDDYKYTNPQRFPWLKVAGEAVICLTRIENPDYQK